MGKHSMPIRTAEIEDLTTFELEELIMGATELRSRLGFSVDSLERMIYRATTTRQARYAPFGKEF